MLTPGVYKQVQIPHEVKGIAVSYTIQTSCLAFLNSQTIQVEIDGASSCLTVASLHPAISNDVKAVTDKALLKCSLMLKFIGSKDI